MPLVNIVANGSLPEPGGCWAIAGRIDSVEEKKHSYYSWKVKNPINLYDVSFYIGDYMNWKDTLMGEKGKLDLSFYVLRYNEERAKKHFAVTKQMLHCFEYWMGPYPFYEDGYKLVEAPFLGMEHQSAVAYGNEYKMGYLGRDRSSSGVGTLFDFIIVHESGHEWFGNNITAQDIADNWLHEGFTTYTEALFAECAFGKEKAFEYTRGEWKNIRNDAPVIGAHGVHDDGSGDKYDKGSAVVHMIRTMMNDDEKFRQLLRGLNKDFYHKIVTSAMVEAYIMDFTGLELNAFFEEYLYTTQIPQLEWYIKDKELFYKFNNVVTGFTLPLPISSGKTEAIIKPTMEWQHINWKGGYNITVSPDFLITEKQ
jgi:aminopeptidase N